MSLAEIYRRARTIRTGAHLTTINAFTDQVGALDPAILREAAWGLIHMAALNGNKIVGEEDKGAHIATAVSLFTGLPMTLARWYVYPIDEHVEDSVVVSVRSEYFSGRLVLNGIDPGDRLILVDDTLATGGTICAIDKAVRRRGARIAEVLAVVEKTGFGGRERIEQEVGAPVRTLMRIAVRDGWVEVCE